MLGGGTTAVATPVVVNNALVTGSQKRKHGLAPTRKVPSVERELRSANGFITTGTAVGTETRSNQSRSEACLCVMCSTRTHELVSLQNNEELTRMLIAYVGLPSNSIDLTTSYVCVQCILKMKLFEDMRTRSKAKIKRNANTVKNTGPAKVGTTNISSKTPTDSVTNASTVDKNSSPSAPYSNRRAKRSASAVGHAQQSADPAQTGVPNKRSREFITSTPKDFVTTENLMRPLSRNSTINQPSHVTDSAASPAVALPPSAGSQESSLQPALDGISNNQNMRLPASRSSSRNGHNSSMLDVVYELKESALITESGGKVNNYGRLDDPHALRTIPQHFICKNCERVYQRKHFYSKHMRRCRPRTAKSLVEQSKKTAKSRRLSDIEEARKKAVIHCGFCTMTVDSMPKLRKHRQQIHMSRLYCPTCGSGFNALQDYEFHCAECSSKHLHASIPTIRRVTRSQSRAASLAAVQVDNSRPSSALLNRLRNQDDDDVDRSKNKKTNNNNNYSKNSYYYYGDNDDDDDDEDDELTSVADTMYTNRMRYTDDWVEDHSERANNDLFLTYLDEEYLTINSSKEYDLYLLDRLKMYIMLESFPCAEPNCRFRGDSHCKLMMHEFCDHHQKLLFHCKKCGNNFTRKVHLDFHLYCQNGGRYICYKCGDVFEFQDQLDRHLIRHTKSVNYRCNYCNFEFLTKTELLEHGEIENHDPNGERKLISIDHSMTIVNPTPSTQWNTKLTRRQYTEHIMEMHLPAIPEPPAFHNRFRRRLQVGDIQFKGQTHPNCSSCTLYI